MSGGNTRIGDGQVTIDASRSFDPDGEEGALSFSWSCAPPAGPLVGAAFPPVPEYSGCLSADGTPARIEGATTPAVAAELLGTPAGANYSLTVTVAKGDRAISSSVWLVVVAKSSPPVISVEGLTAAKVNPTAKLTLRASVASAFPGSLVTAWSVASPPDLANFLARPGVAGTPLSSPSLVINAGSLPPRSTLVLRLSASDAGGRSEAEIAVPVSGTPTGPSGAPGTKGAITASPPSGLGLTTPFTLRCNGWTDTDLPLTFAFGYTIGGSSATRTFLSDFKPSSELSGALLPAGDPTSGYAVSVFCLVQNSFGAVAESDSVSVRVEWDQAVLADTAAQSALVSAQAAEATSKVLTGSPDAALAAVSGLAALVNTDPATRRRRSLLAAAPGDEARRRLLRRRLAAAEPPTEDERAKAAQRSTLLSVVSDVVLVSAPTPTVRMEGPRRPAHPTPHHP